jgi:MinD-like ATPase involved in chromosome partitioning or flagellar assembly
LYIREVMMEAITLALALPSGELASKMTGLIEGHPLLELCGIARSIPDLMRMLGRFHPMAQLISPALVEELGAFDLRPEEARLLSSPLSFLLAGPDLNWDEKELDRVLRQPLRYCGLIDGEAAGAEDLFSRIRYKIELYSRERKAGAPRPDREGRSIHNHGFLALAGAKGGVGTTLISCCLAAALSSSGRRVLLADLDCDLSQLAHLMPEDGGKTMMELLPMAEEVSWDLVQVSVHRHAAGFHLLPYGESKEGSTSPREGIPETFLRNLLFLFDTVIVDSPRPLSRAFLMLLRRSPMVLLVSKPDTLSAQCAKRTASCLRRTGLDHHHLRLIVNGCGSHHVLRPDELSSAAGVELLASLPRDERSGMDFSELGEMPGDNSPLAKSVAQMASSLGYDIAPPGKPPAGTWLNSLLRRREHLVL